MLKIMLFALHYAKLFQILLDYASHQKCMPINTLYLLTFVELSAVFSAASRC